MTKKWKEHVAQREARIELLANYCKKKYKQAYTPEIFDIYLAGYEYCRRRNLKNKQL